MPWQGTTVMLLRTPWTPCRTPHSKHNFHIPDTQGLAYPVSCHEAFEREGWLADPSVYSRERLPDAKMQSFSQER
jgi:hypothetical protein